MMSDCDQLFLGRRRGHEDEGHLRAVSASDGENGRAVEGGKLVLRDDEMGAEAAR
jgi:hypothetical protein